MNQLAQLFVNGLVTGSVLALAGIGVSLVYGILGVVNFAQGDYITYGAFAAVLVNVGLGASMVLSTLAAVVAIALLALVLEYAFWRPMRRRRARIFGMLVASLGLSLMMRAVLFLVATAEPRTYAVDLFQVSTLGPIRLSTSQLGAIAIAAAAIVSVALLFARTRIGHAMRALSDDPELAAIAGVDTDRAVALAWLLTGALAGLAGVVAGLIQSSFDPNMGLVLLLPVFAAVVVGGIGNPYGALAGGLLLGVVMEVSTWSGLAGGIQPVWKQVVAFAVLVVALLVRPHGLLGRARPA